MIWAIVIYVLGMVAGFIFAASKKDSWWNNSNVYSSNREIPFIIMIFWWAFFPGYVVVIVSSFGWRHFISALNGTFDLLNKTQSYLNSRKEKFKNKKIAKAIYIPSPIVREGYRDSGPMPCVACGTPTSIDQSRMEVVFENKNTLLTKMEKERY